MKKKIILITLLIFLLTAIITFIVKFSLDVNSSSKENEEKVEVINTTYEDLTKNIEEFNQVRMSVGEIFSDFIYTNVNDNMPSWKKTFSDYENVIKNITENTKILKENCIMIFKNSNVNKKCDNYKSYYNQIIDLYYDDVNEFNDGIKNYNIEVEGLDDYRKEEEIKIEVERIDL